MDENISTRTNFTQKYPTVNFSQTTVSTSNVMYVFNVTTGSVFIRAQTNSNFGIRIFSFQTNSPNILLNIRSSKITVMLYDVNFSLLTALPVVTIYN